MHVNLSNGTAAADRRIHGAARDTGALSDRHGVNETTSKISLDTFQPIFLLITF
jgi:hypothetical protein